MCIISSATTVGKLRRILENVHSEECTASSRKGFGQEARVRFINKGAKIAGLVLCGFLLVMAVGFIAWTYVYRNTPVVKKSQPFFLITVCLGSVLMALVIIPESLTFEDTTNLCRLDIACMLSPWLFQVGFVTAFSAMFSKLFRVNKLFRGDRRFLRMTVQTKDVMIPFICILSVTMSVLIAWTVVAPLKYKIIVHSYPELHDYVNDIFAICAAKDGRESDALWFALSLFVIDCAVLTVANVQAYKARYISTEYSGQSLNASCNAYCYVSETSLITHFLTMYPHPT
mmetsp:Transcript_44759/g.136591  ORF Transcript_44759/g.136591 Transcript_44759/m.136591 type:complete len:286 (-) Transcript_44759:478-1335(-)